MIQPLIGFFQRVFAPWHAAQPVAPRPQAAAIVPERICKPSPPAPAGRRGRPVSTTLTRAIAILERKPDISSSELARELKVSASYARTLLRRARVRTPEPETLAPVSQETVRVEEGMQVSEILTRLQTAETEIQQLRTSRPGLKQRWDLSRRAEVIRRGLAGENPVQIAARLQVPQGEVRFILKVHRLLMQSH